VQSAKLGQLELYQADSSPIFCHPTTHPAPNVPCMPVLTAGLVNTTVPQVVPQSLTRPGYVRHMQSAQSPAYLGWVGGTVLTCCRCVGA
jgi:hypothetical protein